MADYENEQVVDTVIHHFRLLSLEDKEKVIEEMNRMTLKERKGNGTSGEMEVTL